MAKRLLLTVIAFVAAMAAMPAAAWTVGDFEYEYYGNKARLTGLTDEYLATSPVEVHVPGFVKGPDNAMHQVVIGSRSFYQCSVNRLYLGYGVTEIEDEAFVACLNLKRICLSSTVEKVGKKVFSGSGISGSTLEFGWAILSSSDLSKRVNNFDLDAFGGLLSSNVDLYVSTEAVRYALVGYNDYNANATDKQRKFRKLFNSRILNPILANDYELLIDGSRTYYVITTMASSSVHGASTLVGSTGEDVHVQINSKRMDDYDATVNPVSYDCQSIYKEAYLDNSEIKTFLWDRANRYGGQSEFGESCFKNAKNLKSVTTNAYKVGGLINCTNLETLTLMEGVVKLTGVTNAKLTTLNLPASLDIYDPAKPATDINAFSNVPLKTFTLSSGSRYTIYDDCLYQDDALLWVPERLDRAPKIKPGTKVIAGGAFYHFLDGNPLIIDFLDLPYGLEIIGDWAFYYAHIAWLHVPGSVKTIGVNAFSEMVYGRVMLGIRKPLDCVPGIRSTPPPVAVCVPADAMADYKAHKSWKILNLIPGGYDVLASDDPTSPYYNLPLLLDDETLTAEVCLRNTPDFYDSMTYEKRVMGVKDENGYRVEIPETVTVNGKTYTITSIGSLAFYESDVYSVTVPKTVKHMGGPTYSVANQDLTIWDGGGQFWNAKKLRILKWPDFDIKAIPAQCFYNMGSDASNPSISIRIPYGGTIGYKAFHNSAVTRVALPSSMTSVNLQNLFKGCSRMHTLDVNSRTPVFSTLSKSDLSGLSNLRRLVVPVNLYDKYYPMWTGALSNGLVNIGTYDGQVTINSAGDTFTFTVLNHDKENDQYNVELVYSNYNPQGISNVDTRLAKPVSGLGPDTENQTVVVTALADSCFAGLTNKPLQTITLGPAVQRIGKNAMTGATKLQHITSLASNPPALGSDVWLGVTQKNVNLSVPEGTKTAYAAADQWKEFLITDDADAVKYGIYIAGVQLTSQNYNTLLPAGMSFDGDKTLTMENVSLNVARQIGQITMEVDQDLTIVLKGANTLRGYLEALHVKVGNTVKITGDGTLTLRSTSAAAMQTEGTLIIDNTNVFAGGVYAVKGERITNGLRVVIAGDLQVNGSDVTLVGTTQTAMDIRRLNLQYCEIQGDTASWANRSYTFVNAAGNPVVGQVDIKSTVQKYPIYINNVQLTNANIDELLPEGMTYDGDKTLTMSHVSAYYEEGPGLRIVGDIDLVLDDYNRIESKNDYALWVDKGANFNIKGNEPYVEGMHFRSSGKYGVVNQGNLNISDCRFEAWALYEGTNPSYAMSGGVEGQNIGDVTMDHCMMLASTNNVNYGATIAGLNSLTLNRMESTEPTGIVWSPAQHSLVNPNGSIYRGWVRFDPVDGITGDVNGDGSVNAADVTALYNYILNGDTTFVANSDVNGDGAINAGDVTAVYNIILGL